MVAFTMVALYLAVNTDEACETNLLGGRGSWHPQLYSEMLGHSEATGGSGWLREEASRRIHCYGRLLPAISPVYELDLSK